MVNPEKVKTYGRKNKNVGVGSPKWVALSGINTVYGLWVKAGHDYSVGSR